MTAPTLAHRSNAGRSLWLQWMLATATGSTLGAVVGGALITTWLQSFPPVSDPLATADITIPRIAAAFGVWGAGIGLLQLLLRRRLVSASWWPLATLGGWAIAGALTSALHSGGAVTGRAIDIGLIGFVAQAVATILAIGLLSGLFQWLILRQQADRAGRWVWITLGGIALGMLVAPALLLGPARALGWLRPEDFPSAQSWGVAGAVVGVVDGAVSGWALIRLPRPVAAQRMRDGRRSFLRSAGAHESRGVRARMTTKAQGPKRARGLWPQWILATTAGFIIGGVAAGAAAKALEARGGDEFGLTPWEGAVVGALAGLTIGIGQWLVSRRAIVHAGWWAPAVIGVWIIFDAILAAAGRINPVVGAGGVAFAALVFALL